MNWINEIKDRCRRTVEYCHSVTGSPRSIIVDTIEDACHLMEVLESLQDDLELLAEKLYAVLQDGPTVLNQSSFRGSGRISPTHVINSGRR